MAKFKIWLEGKPNYRLDEEISVTVNIKNITGKTYFLKRTGTPFSRRHNDCFNIFIDEERLPYDSIMAKVMDAGIQDFMRIGPRETKKVEIALAQRYNFPKPGKYHINIDGSYCFTGNPAGGKIFAERVKGTAITVRIEDGNGIYPTRGMTARLYRGSKERTVSDVDFPEPNVELKPGNYPEGFDKKFKNMVCLAHYELIHYLQHCVLEMECDPGERMMNYHYRMVFGKYDRKRYLKVQKNLENILNAMKHQVISYMYDPHEDCCAYMYPGSQMVYLCEWFINKAELSGTDSRLGAILHELTHVFAKTEDYNNTYGREQCLELAKREPDKAIINADNYEFYVESVFLNWADERKCPYTENSVSFGEGAPTAAEWNEEIYLFYCSDESTLCMSVFDGRNFEKSKALTDETGKVFKIEKHPEVIVYDNKMHLFYFAEGELGLSHTWRNLYGKWITGTQIKDSDGNMIMMESVPQPVLYNNTIYLFYKKFGGNRFAYTFWDAKNSEWAAEGNVNDLIIPDMEEMYNPAVAVYHGTLFLFYLNRESNRIKAGFFDKSRNRWLLDISIKLLTGISLDSGMEMRAAVIEDSLYLLFRRPDGTPAQMQLNGLALPGQDGDIIFTDGESLEENAEAPAVTPRVDSLCAVAKLKHYNYMFYQCENEDGIFYSRQMNGITEAEISV